MFSIVSNFPLRSAISYEAGGDIENAELIDWRVMRRRMLLDFPFS
jgi:hypothetical protein